MNRKTVKKRYDLHFGIDPNDDELDFYFDLINLAKAEEAISVRDKYLKENNLWRI